VGIFFAKIAWAMFIFSLKWLCCCGCPRTQLEPTKRTVGGPCGLWGLLMYVYVCADVNVDVDAYV